MELSHLIKKANEFYNVDVTQKIKFADKAFIPKCLTVRHAIVEMKTPYIDLMEAFESDRNELRLMWLYADGHLGLVKTRRQHKQFLSTL